MGFFCYPQRFREHNGKTEYKLRGQWEKALNFTATVIREGGPDKSGLMVRLTHGQAGEIWRVSSFGDMYETYCSPLLCSQCSLLG